MGLAALLTIKPTLTIGSYAPRLPWPWGLVDIAAKIMRPPPGTVRATISLPNCTAQLVRAAGVLPADGKRSVILYLHGGAFLTCGVNTHGRLVAALSKHADSPVLVANYRMIPDHSVGTALDDCYDAYKWLRETGYEPDQIVLAGDSAGGYLALALAERLQVEGINGYTGFMAGDPDMAGTYGGYDGPCPPWNDELLHHYHFRLFALDVDSLTLPSRFGGADLLQAMKGHVLAEAEIHGTYSLYYKD